MKTMTVESANRDVSTIKRTFYLVYKFQETLVLMISHVTFSFTASANVLYHEERCPVIHEPV